MADLSNAAPDIQLPMNAAEQRDSAHFQEVSFRYYFGMSQIWKEKYDEIVEERDALPRYVQITKFAQPHYVYPERPIA